MYSVLLVEDDWDTLTLLEGVINASSQLEVVGICSSISSAKSMIDARQPAVLLTDLGLPDGNGSDLIRYVYEKYPDVLIMVLSMFGDEHNALTAILAGAKGYILKQADNYSIAESVLQMINGASPISPSIARYLLVKLQNSETTVKPNHHFLTQKEIQVLELVSQGYRSREIADKLYISYHTVVHHIRAIYDKLAVNSRSQAIYKASKIGLLNSQS